MRNNAFARFQPRATSGARRHGLGLGAAAVVFLGLAGSAQAKCQRDRFVFYTTTSAITTQWRVENKGHCVTNITTRGVISLENFVVSQRAAHGTAAAGNNNAQYGFAYIPNPGYVGPDHFQITTDNIDNKATDRHKMTIDVNVDVVDKM